LAILLLLSIGVFFWILPYSRATLDLSLLSLREEGESAKLYVPDLDCDMREENVTYHLSCERLPSVNRKRKLVNFDELPDHLVHAFIAIEDKRFFEHHGVDIIRTGHALWDFLVHKGKADFGGSTITQQLIKNLTGYRDRTPERKLTEIFTALDLEKKVDKETILTVYLNVINLGGGCEGVGAAAEYYFGKTVDELTLPECAALAAITNNPTLYNPRTHPEENTRRQRIILSEMKEKGYITSQDYDTAVNTPLVLRPEPEVNPRMTSWYTEMVAADVLRDLQARLGYTYEKASRLLSTGDLSIETVMDESLQRILTKYYETEENFPMGTHGRPQSAAVIIDPHNGDILAVAGAVGVKNAYYLQNYATAAKRPAGSVIKPPGIYAPALHEGLITWGSVWEDLPVGENEGHPWPRNADGLYRGRVTLRDAVAHSLNTVPVALAQQLGVENSFRFLKERLHMDSLIPASGKALHDMTLSSVALGQQSEGVTVREMTAAYTIFTEGLYHAPVSYRRVLDREGNVLLENKPRGERVLTRNEAALMTRLLETVTEDGTARGLWLKDKMGISVAGKTGTTQNNWDRWFIGYTPRLLCGVWMGYEYPVPLEGIDGNPCLGIFDDVMISCETVYSRAPFREGFERSPEVIPVRICPLSGQIITPDCINALPAETLPRVGWFIEGSEPRDCCRLHYSLWQEVLEMPQEDTTELSETLTTEPPIFTPFRPLLPKRKEP